MIWTNTSQNHVHAVIDKLPHRTSIPTLLLVMEIHLPTPDNHSGWSGWQVIVQCGPNNVAGHPWVRIGLPLPGEQGDTVKHLSGGNGKGKEVVQDQEQVDYTQQDPEEWSTSRKAAAPVLGHHALRCPVKSKVVFDGVVVPTPAWLVKAHLHTPSHSPSEAVP
ncbi:hypothetical protein V8B97DRAFT_1921116 [Scleroderma yunnanense]